MQSLHHAVTLLVVTLMAGEIVTRLRARRAIDGSHQRFVALTIRRVFSWAANIGLFIQGVLALVIGSPLGFLPMIYAVVLAVYEVNHHKDDDDWFKGRAKKIGRGLKNAFTVRIRIPSPARA